MKIVILANDIGEKLWPLTNADLPKALLPLYSENSMLVETIFRCAPMCKDGKDIFVVSTHAAKKRIKKEKIVSEFKIPLKNILTINEFNNLYLIIQELDELSDDDEPIIFIPSDQFFWPEEVFQFHIMNTVGGLESYPEDILVLTMQPGLVAGNMKYFDFDFSRSTTVGTTLTAKEEPIITTLTTPTEIKQPIDFKEAENLILDGWVWDLNTFVGKLGTFKKYLKNTNDPAQQLLEDKHLKITLADKVIWSVLDNWASLKYLTFDIGLFPIKDDPKVHSIDSTNNLVKKEDKKEVILIGVDNLIIIDTADKLLIATPGGAHEHL